MSDGHTISVEGFSGPCPDCVETDGVWTYCEAHLAALGKVSPPLAPVLEWHDERLDSYAEGWKVRNYAEGKWVLDHAPFKDLPTMDAAKSLASSIQRLLEGDQK